MLTVVIPSFFSSQLVEERIKEIDSNIPIIVIENSRDFDFKKKIEKNYKNVNIIVPKENLGFGPAYNVGIRNSKTEMVFLTQPDVLLIDNCIDKLIECSKEFKDFSVITPNDSNNKIFTNFEIYNKYPIIKNKFSLKEVDYVDLTWLINKSNFTEEDLWDEQIFHYFEATDFAKRLKNKNKKIFVAEKIKTYHIGAASHDKRLEFYSKLHRNWHYNWSRHYYHKKHFGFFYAFRKSFALLIKLSIKYIKATISFKNKEEKKLIFTELHGLISSMMNKTSYYRAYKNINLSNL